jgi:hypothetical protein
VRQVGICHVYNRKKKASRWILLNPSQYVRERVVAVLQSRAASTNECSGTMAALLHATLLSATNVNWTAYIDDLQSDVKVYVSCMHGVDDQ